MNEWTCRLCNPSVTSVGDWRCVLCHCHDNREVMQRMLRSSWIYVSHCASDESLYERVCVCAVTCCSHKNACCMRSTCIVTVCSRRSKVQFSKLSYTLHSIQARARPKPRRAQEPEAKQSPKVKVQVCMLCVRPQSMRALQSSSSSSFALARPEGNKGG